MYGDSHQSIIRLQIGACSCAVPTADAATTGEVRRRSARGTARVRNNPWLAMVAPPERSKRFAESQCHHPDVITSRQAGQREGEGQLAVSARRLSRVATTRFSVTLPQSLIDVSRGVVNSVSTPSQSHR